MSADGGVMADSSSQRRCGFVALVGAPNAGKSTLINYLVGSKISIVTPKVQTTRTRIIGIAIRGDSQLIFVDTPGIFVPRRQLDRAMVAAAWAGAHNADLVVHIVDAAAMSPGTIDDDSRRIIDGLRDAGRQAQLALNKVDLVKPQTLLGNAEALNREGIYSETFMISALTGDGVDDLAAFVADTVPVGPWLYPEDQIADVPMRLLAAEITREKIFMELHHELPYAATVETETWTEQKDGSVRIDQVVYVQRDSQKPIVLGKGGRQIKKIGEQARLELETALEQRVHLFLFVKVRKKWAEDPERYREMGLDFSE
jgi:GTP-binding protein Era